MQEKCSQFLALANEKHCNVSRTKFRAVERVVLPKVLMYIPKTGEGFSAVARHQILPEHSTLLSVSAKGAVARTAGPYLLNVSPDFPRHPTHVAFLSWTSHPSAVATAAGKRKTGRI